MTKQEWLDRCEMVYDLGFVDSLDIAKQGTDYLMRVKAGQDDTADSIMKEDLARSDKVLANDIDAYNALQAMCILTKQCQKCATNPDAWHCRGCNFGCESMGCVAQW